MSTRRIERRTGGAKFRRMRRFQIVIAAIVLLSVMATWTMLGYSRGFRPAHGRTATNVQELAPAAEMQEPSPASLTANPKEYVYAGSRLIATEEQGGSQGTGAGGFDFGTDHKSDISIFRPSDGNWWFLDSNTLQQTSVGWGINGDIIVPADYDGDGTCDVAVFRPSNGTWFVIKSMGGTINQQFGVPGDIPVPGDYDGDGKADIAIYRPSNGTWWVLNQPAVGWGINNDRPVPADYDGDGKCDKAIFRPGDGTWWVIKSTDGGTIYQQFGVPGDIPVPGDYDGDGKANIAVYRPSTGTWWIFNQPLVGWGSNGDIPVPTDYDGDGKCDVAVFRPSNGTWWIIKSSGGTIYQLFGVTGDIPVPSAYIRQ
jgi:hypothetical protein